MVRATTWMNVEDVVLLKAGEMGNYQMAFQIGKTRKFWRQRAPTVAQSCEGIDTI